MANGVDYIQALNMNYFNPYYEGLMVDVFGKISL